MGQAAEDVADEQPGDLLDRLRTVRLVPGPRVVAHAEDLQRGHLRIGGVEHPFVRPVAEDVADDRRVARPLVADVAGEVAVEVADEFAQAGEARGAVVPVRGEQRVERNQDGGTRIELQVPGAIVYRAGRPRGPWPWNRFRRKNDFAAD